MLASQVNLDHRLAELRQVGTELRDAQAATRTRATRTVVSAIRSLFAGAPAARPTRTAAAH